jgi:hypothetical protein
MSSTVTLFWMEGCGACAHNKKAWTEFKKLYKNTREVESKKVKPSDNVVSFPTMRCGDKTIVGAHESGKEIAEALGIALKGGHRTRRQRARRLTRRKYLRIA